MQIGKLRHRKAKQRSHGHPAQQGQREDLGLGLRLTCWFYSLSGPRLHPCLSRQIQASQHVQGSDLRGSGGQCSKAPGTSQTTAISRGGALQSPAYISPHQTPPGGRFRSASFLGTPPVQSQGPTLRRSLPSAQRGLDTLSSALHCYFALGLANHVACPDFGQKSLTFI